MGKRTPPFPPYPAWTQGKFWSFLRSGLRRCYSRWPPKYEVLVDCKRPYKGEDKRRKFEYQCSDCKKYFKSTAIEVDHIVPAGSLTSFEHLPGFVERLFVGKEGLRVLCKPCHKERK